MSVNKSDRAIAISILVCALLGLIALVLHPTLGDAKHSDVQQAMHELDTLNRAVHGSVLLICVVLSMFFAYYHRVRNSMLAESAWIAFLFGAIAACIAGTINGFVVPDLILSGLANDPEQAWRKVLWAINQRASYFGILSMLLAFAIWSVDLLRGAPTAPKRGGFMLAVSALGLLVVLHSGGHMTVRAMQWFGVALLLWSAIASSVLWQRSPSR